MGGQLHLQDRQRSDGLPLRGVQGHLPLCLPAGPEGLHHLPLQPGRLPGRAGQGEGPGEHHLPVRAGGRLRAGGEGQRGDRVRRRDPHRRQPIRRAQGGVLRQVLKARLPPRAAAGHQAAARVPGRPPRPAVLRYGARIAAIVPIPDRERPRRAHEQWQWCDRDPVRGRRDRKGNRQ